MPVQLPRRRDVRGNRKYAQPITRRNIQAVQGQRDPGAQGGPNASATPLAFGGGKGLIDAGEQLQQLGAQWQKQEMLEQAQRNKIRQEAILLNLKYELDQLQIRPKTAGIAKPSSRPNLPNAGGGGYMGPMTSGGDVADMGVWKENK